MEERERYDKGMAVRRAVLGDAHVDRTLTRRNEFNEEYQDLITKVGSIPESSSPAVLRQILNQTLDDVASTIREFGMQQD